MFDQIPTFIIKLAMTSSMSTFQSVMSNSDILNICTRRNL